MKILLILLLALILRLITLNQSLWLDEAITAVAVKNNNLVDLVSKFSLGDLHPPLHYVLLWFWGQVFGYSEISLRMPSVILGVLTVWLTYLIGKSLVNKKVGLTAGLLLSIAPLHIYYSQEARMYSLAAFTATLSFYFLIRMIKGKSWSWLGLLGANVLVFYTDYVVYLIVPAQIFYVLMCSYTDHKEGKPSKGLAKRYFSALVLALSTLIFWEPVFLMQLSNGIATANTLTGWANVVGGAGFKELALIPIKTFIGRISFENKQVYGLVVGILGIMYGYILWHGIRKFDLVTKLLLFWIIVPVVLSFTISIYVPVLSYFRLIFILPAFYLLLAKGLENLPQRLFKPVIFAVICVNLIFVGMYYTFPKFQREDWRGMVDFVSRSDKEVVLENNDKFAPILYYANNSTYFIPGLKKVPAKSFEDISDVKERDIYVLQYLVDITDPDRLLKKKLVEQGYKLKVTQDFNGIGFLDHYSK